MAQMKHYLLSVVICTAMTPSFAAEDSKPLIREDECLAIFDQVDTGVQVLPVIEYKTRLWDRRFREAEASDFAWPSKEKLEDSRQKDLSKDVEYLIFPKGVGTEIFVDFSFSLEDTRISKLVELESGKTVEVSHLTDDGTRWISVEINWTKDTNEFIFQRSQVEFSEDGVPDYVVQGHKYIGVLECAQDP